MNDDLKNVKAKFNPDLKTYSCIKCGCTVKIPDQEMCDACFDDLKGQIEDCMYELAGLQKTYIKLTGRRFVPPIRLKPRKKECHSAQED